MDPITIATKIIMEFEGCKLQAYLCPSGVPTIGWGHTEGVQLGMSISQEEADLLLHEDAHEFADGVLKLVTVSLNPNQFGALISFTFNIGLNAFKLSTMLRKINAGDHEGAKGQFGRWVYGKGVILPGLVRRRKAEAELYGTIPEEEL